MKKRIFLIFITIVMLIPIISCSNKNEPIYGTWVSEKGTMYKFEDNKYEYYLNKDDINNNYCKGPVTIINGKDALEKAKYSSVEYIAALKDYCGKEKNVFSVQMMKDTMRSKNVDSSFDVKDNLINSIIMISKDDKDKAVLIDVDTNIFARTDLKLTRVK